MKLILFILSFSLVSQAVVFTKPDTNVAVYSGATPHFVPSVNATDMCTIFGSASKVIRVTSLEIFTNQTTISSNQIHFLKRSTANSGGAARSVTAIPLDSGKAAATATVAYYTGGNPVVGTSLGALKIARVVSAASNGVLSPVYEFFAPLNQFDPVILRGTGEGLVVNFAGVAIPTGFTISCNFKWIEE